VSKTPAILSLLHQDQVPASTTRIFREQSVLRWTLERLSRCPSLEKVTVLCWANQFPGLRGFENVIALPRVHLPSLQAISAARRWADGWRGGLLSATCFDLGFHGPSVLAAMKQLEAEQVVLIDPDSALIDPAIVESLISHADEHPDVEYAFTPAAVGQSAILLRRPLVEKLAQSGTYPGRLLNYHPDVPGRDPIAMPACAPVPTAIARASERFALDSRRQIELFERATHPLNGQLMGTDAEELLKLIRSRNSELDFPRDLTLEISTARLTRPIYSPLRYGTIQRPDMSLEIARQIFSQLGRCDDIRLTLAGVGDPLLHPQFTEIVQAAADEGIKAVHVETDLLTNVDEKRVASPFSILSVHIPAVTQQTYKQIMDLDQLPQLIENMRRFLQLRGERATPILVPTFIKCRENLAEMEPWYDHWIRHLGCAVITGPSDCASQIPDVAAIDMSPPKRVPCRRLKSRMTILSTGQIVACENDVHGLYPLGKIGRESISEIWRKSLGLLREEHQAGRYSLPICESCRDWHRP
jgi:hypothetical protein